MSRLTRREWIALTGGLLAACGDEPAPRPAPPVGTDLDSLVAAIGRSRPRDTHGIVDAARVAGAPVQRVLAAAWLAMLEWGGLREDVHAALVLPSIDRLAAAARALGDDAWLPVRFAVANAATWCTDVRVPAPQPVARATPATLIASIRAAEEDDAVRQTVALCRSSSAATAATLRTLLVEALEPREDVHAAIYAAQTARFVDALPAAARPRVLSHLARYLARVPRWPRVLEPASLTSTTLVRPARVATEPSPLEGPAPVAARTDDLAWALAADPWMRVRDASAREVCDALVVLAAHARVQDPTPSGLGCHRTTHLDAMIDLARRVPPDRVPHAIASMVPSTLRGPDTISPTPLPASARAAETAATRDLVRYRVDTAHRLAKHADHEHAFKYWAALDTLTEVASPDLLPRLWRGASFV